MRRLDPEYDPDTQLGEHTLERVREALIDQERRARGARLLVPFARMLLCDAWLGNGDRHPANWSILESPRGVRLAPIYDTAACLGPELLDGHPLLNAGSDYDVSLKRYIARCKSGFGRGGSRTVAQRDVVTDLGGWPEFVDATSIVTKFEELLAGDLRLYIEAIGHAWLPAPRARLAGDLLEQRLAWLKRVL
jgi:hypothetical protein